MIPLQVAPSDEGASNDHGPGRRVWARLMPTRSRPPDTAGRVVRNGVSIAYETYGDGPATILMLPTWSVLDAAHGRFQLIDLSRNYRVVTFDPRGNGRSDRPEGREAYGGEEFVEDAVAVLDATGTDRAVVVACSLATHWLLRLAAEHPERVLGAVASGTNLPLATGHERPEIGPFEEPFRSSEGWAKFNAHYWEEDYEGFLRFFFSQVWTEPHSHRLIDACVANGLQTAPATLVQTIGANPLSADEATELIRRTRCPWLVVHGDGDELQPHNRGERLAHETGGSLVTFAGAGHCSGNRDPVRFNLVVREFTEEILGWRPRRRTWTRAQSRPRRVVLVPGNPAAVERDILLADALRACRPGIEVQWLVGDPARTALVERGEMVHSGSADMPQLTGGGDDPFEAWWDGDEAQFLSFMVLLDASAQEPIDLVIADGARGIDHHLHDNPELKHWAYAWLTDAIGWAARPDEDDRRRQLMADANAEMVAQVERYPRIRDRALFAGSLEDVRNVPFGPELPSMRAWARDRFTFSGADRQGFARAVADRLVELL